LYDINKVLLNYHFNETRAPTITRCGQQRNNCHIIVYYCTARYGAIMGHMENWPDPSFIQVMHVNIYAHLMGVTFEPKHAPSQSSSFVARLFYIYTTRHTILPSLCSNGLFLHGTNSINQNSMAVGDILDE